MRPRGSEPKAPTVACARPFAISMRRTPRTACRPIALIASRKLAPGEIDCVDIDLFPIGLALNPGEQLRLIISGRHLLGGAMPGVDNVPSDNHGWHVIHTGDRHASYLQLPQKA